MADVYDVVSAYQLDTGDFARISGKEVVLTTVDDQGDSIFVQGNCISEADSEFEAELHPDIQIELLTE